MQSFRPALRRCFFPLPLDGGVPLLFPLPLDGGGLGWGWNGRKWHSDACHPHPGLPPSRGKEQYVAALGGPRFSGAFEALIVSSHRQSRWYPTTLRAATSPEFPQKSAGKESSYSVSGAMSISPGQTTVPWSTRTRSKTALDAKVIQELACSRIGWTDNRIPMAFRIAERVLSSGFPCGESVR